MAEPQRSQLQRLSSRFRECPPNQQGLLEPENTANFAPYLLEAVAKLGAGPQLCCQHNRNLSPGGNVTRKMYTPNDAVLAIFSCAREDRITSLRHHGSKKDSDKIAESRVAAWI